ncbi:inositol monophosphatase family protein [Pontibacter sp. G13]|uniref:3'(2'),5'-bisphosphate nucleotidase CysQ family protein n=1 Tax=Pontibacter sp. G13 TaxID=3074898 RepID=UPI0028895C6F|nr:inositol monophosphatase family protein [Pontibacter sp. G13]WNJ20009.1 inositol monophosphatase family protein [Pontibacter sp. G13]
MPVSHQDLFLLSRCAISAAYEAGHYISAKSSDFRQLTDKVVPGGSLASQVVTEVDLASQELILKHLLPTCEWFDLGMLAEEGQADHSRHEKAYFWCVDPLDGTLPFTEGVAGYAVSIALVQKDGTPEIGVIYDPLGQICYHAIRGHGMFRNGIRFERKQAWVPASDQSIRVFIDRSMWADPRFEGFQQDMTAWAKTQGWAGIQVESGAGGAMNACWGLEQAPSCYVKYPKKELGGGSLWDFAATACLYPAWGAVVTDIFGKPLDLNRPDSTFMNVGGLCYATDHEISHWIQEWWKSHSK